jgi:hypothetical protein
VRRLVVLALASALALPSSAAAKDFRTIALVGPRGDSLSIPARDALIGSFFNPGRRVRPRGGYALLYVLGRDEFPGIPGRYYPAVRAACFGWAEIGVRRDCRRVNPTLAHLLRPAAALSRFHAAPTVVRLFHGRRSVAVIANVAVAVELALGRSLRARPAARPRSCIVLRARWRGPSARARPRSLCLARAGVWARGRLYPLGPGVWSWARLNLGGGS